MTPAEALQLIRGPTTKDFLFSNVVTIGSRSSGPADYYIAQEPRANADVHDIFRISEPGPSGPPQGGLAFRAIGVLMRNRDTLMAGIDGLQLPNQGPEDIMVTGMLTSCSFMYSTDKNNMFCAHIEPTRIGQSATKGLDLGTSLRGGAVPFSNDAGGVRYFTRNDYEGTHHANLLGVRRVDGWSIYVQGITPGTSNIVFSRQLI